MRPRPTPTPEPRPTRLRPLRALLALVLLALAGWILLRSGGADGARTIPLDSYADFQRWADDTPTSVMAAAVARLGGLIAVAYLGGVLLVALVAEALRCRTLARVALAATPAAFRRLLGGGAARVGLVAGTVLAPAMAATSASATPVQEGEPPTATMTRTDGDPRSVATMVWLGPEPSPARDGDAPPTSAPSPTSAPTTSIPTASGDSTPAPDTPGPTAPAPTAAGPPPAPANQSPTASSPTPTATSPAPPAGSSRPEETRVVAPGDSFWSIAEEAVGAADDVPRYWQALITANRDRLVAPSCPDLLIPGQILVLPSP